METGDQETTGRIDVAYVANLARLELMPAESREFEGQLQEVVRYVAKIGELDLEEVEPTSHAVDVENVLRSDEETGGLPREKALSNAPESISEHFKVPRIVE
jgi:aspartyl-tRNA(Asn)/glutamyl-tRNA(Gln) amidotransferase subunit C